MEGFTRKRSNSVPILSQIEKVLDQKEDLGLSERRSSEIFSRFCETRSPEDTARPKVRLSSGGLIRNQKRRRSRTMGNTQTGSTQPCEQEQDAILEKATPRAFSTSEVDITNDALESSPTGTTISHSLLKVDEYPQRHDVHAEQERCESFSMMTKREDAFIEQASGIIYSKDTPGDYTVTDQAQGTANIDSCNKEDSLHSGSSTEISLPYEIGDLEEEQTPDLTNSSSIDSSHSDKFGSLISDFDRLTMIELHRTEQGKENELFSNFGRRRNSLPSFLQQRKPAFIEKSDNFVKEVITDLQSAAPKGLKAKTRRSQSSPMTSSRFVGKAKISSNDKYSKHQDVKHGLRQAVGEIENTNEQSRQGKLSRKNRSQSLPTNTSFNLIKRVQQRSLQSHERVPQLKEKTRRVKSLPFIYEGLTESELPSYTQTTHTGLKCSDSIENSKVETERKQLLNEGSRKIKQKALLERASSFPICGTDGQQKQTDSIQKQIKKALDMFFSQKAGDGFHVGRGKRSKSLPNVFEGKKNLNFEKPPVMNIPEAATAEGRQVYDAVSGVGDESIQSCSDEETITNEETKSDVSSEGDELELRISTSAYCHDLPPVPRPRGFSIPCSFKMEKIPEEPNESENCDEVASCDGGDTEDVTNYLCENHSNQTIDSTPLNDNSGVSEQAEDHLTESDVNESSSFESKTEENRQHIIFEHNLELFDKLVTETFSRMQQLEFASSSSCLHRAAAKGDLDSIKLLVEEGDDVNALDEFGWPVLHAAVTTGNFDCCEWLIDAGADLEAYTNFVIEEYRLLSRQVYHNN